MIRVQVKSPFPCNGCGKCCRKVANSPQTVWLDRGDSICKHFDETKNSCTIYDTRPLVCRVEAYYDKNLSHKISWNDFFQINLKICLSL
ncbi:MAG: zinc/iron-chelating domain-containing protein [Comamonadaceae bacterium PBBC1]|nr:MAG: zinc/iron-chelating domain-containing protein [Comamonadaceae bacterium PBBC1]